ncbi:MAG: class I SAM-dependent methyltransferase [bacterium]
MEYSSSIFDQLLYYEHRAEIYDCTVGYQDEVAEQHRAPLKNLISQYFKHRSVYEVACGTGYWTEIIAKFCKSLTAIDISENMVRIAKQRCGDLTNVKIFRNDFYRNNFIYQKLNAAFHHFWFSHIPKSQITQFVNQLHNQLQNDSVIIMSDNIEHSTYPVFYHQSGDCYEIRTLANGKNTGLSRIYTVRR